MTVEVLCIEMSRYYNLIPLAPNTLGKFHTDLLCKLRCDVLILKTEIPMIGLYALRL